MEKEVDKTYEKVIDKSIKEKIAVKTPNEKIVDKNPI